MSFGTMASLVIAIAAVVGVFVEIPILSDYAFWVLFGAYIVWHGIYVKPGKSIRWWTMFSLALLIVAIVGVFVEIPIITTYAFWVLFLAYLVRISVDRLS
jgi:hypothetical protein